MSGSQENGKTILLVEDDAILSKVETLLLQKNGFRVLTAFNGQQAIETARKEQNIDLILMDIDLGSGMDGTDAAQIIIKEKDIPVLFLSGHTDPETVEKTEKITSYGYVVKNSGETVILASIKMAFKLYEAHQRLKEREIALKESEERFSQFMKYLPGFAYIKDSNRKILFVSEQFEEKFEIPLENWLGKTNEEIWPGEVGNKIRQDDETVLRSKIPLTTEEKVPSRGELRTYYSIKFPILKENQTPLLGGISLDITERKRMEEALIQSEVKFATAFNSMPEPMAITDMVSNLMVEVNPAFVKWSGYSRDEMIGHSSQELNLWINPGDRSFVINNLLSGKSVEDKEIQVRLKDGSVKEVIFSAIIFKLNSRSYLLTIAHDITEMKKVQSALRQSEEIFRLFMEHSPVYVFFKDKEIRAIQLSRNYEKMLGRPIQDLIGKNMDDLFPSELAKNMIEDDKRILREGKVIEVIEEFDGRTYTTTKFPIIREGQPSLLAGFTIDITEQKNAERSLTQTIEEKKALLRELQHRIKNSLNLITGIIGLEISRIEDPATREVLKSINSRILSLADLYTFLYKTDNVQEIRLDQYLTQITHSLKKSYLHQQDDIEIISSLEEMTISANDAATIGLVLNEILTNAFKYAFHDKRKGLIDIILRRQEGGDIAYLEVANNGQPLPQDFDMASSAGLGLTLVQMMLHQINGTFQHEVLQEERGYRTVFKIYFPLAKDHPYAKPL